MKNKQNKVDESVFNTLKNLLYYETIVTGEKRNIAKAIKLLEARNAELARDSVKTINKSKLKGMLRDFLPYFLDDVISHNSDHGFLKLKEIVDNSIDGGELSVFVERIADDVK